MSYKGISTKTMKDGSKSIFVRFKHLSKTYPIKNFTKIFGSKTEKQAFDRLQEVKLLISQNQDPFTSKGDTLNDYFYDRYEEKIKNGSWKIKTTAYAYKKYYETVIKNKLGHKKLEKISYEDLKDILKKISNTKGSYQNNLKIILGPIFSEALKRNELVNNPTLLIERMHTPKKQKLTLRVVDSNLSIVKELYKMIGQHPSRKNQLENEMKVFLYMILLTAHRYGELIQLKKEDVYISKNLIISSARITKTKEDYHFPIPIECLHYIQNINSGLLFPNLKYGAISGVFERIVEKSSIELYQDKTLTAHDTRSLMLNIMIKNCKIDSMLADYCLDHKQNGVIEHYLDFHYTSKVESYKKYWAVIKQ